MCLLMLAEWNQPPGWTSFSASTQPAVQVQLLDVHLKLQGNKQSKTELYQRHA